MTMGLAVMMILLLGVMGAGLLTFVSRDLNTVVEQNKGQRAFEMADAGVWAAERQLTSDCLSDTNCKDHYDDNASVVGTEDIQWSAARGGLTLNELDGVGGTKDCVNVRISATGTYDFRVVSTGTYRSSAAGPCEDPTNAKRKIEAIFKGITNVGGGGGLGHPIYYTKSSISIEADPELGGITLDQISMFTEKDVIIEGLQTPAAFTADYGDPNSGVLKLAGGADELGDWNSENTKYYDTPGPWNTRGRIETKIKTTGPKDSPTETVQTPPYIQPGFGAEGKICGFAALDTTTGLCNTDASSVADGVSSYDSTTGLLAPDGITPNPNPRPVVLNGAGTDVAEKCTFMSKEFPPDNLAYDNECYITYPFPRPQPNPSNLKQEAQEADTPTDRHYWDVATDGNPTPTQWETLFPACPNEIVVDPADCMKRVVFVDAQNETLHFDTDNSARNQGVLVVWNGDLQLDKTFKGVILNLNGNGSAFGASSCDGTTCADQGLFRNNGQFCQCWLYSEGNTAARAGVEIGPGSTIKFLPGMDWSFLNDLFQNETPTSFELRGWRELYE
jgi:hypothetical protein